MNAQKNIPLEEHLRELRGCIIKSLIAVGIFSVIAYNFSNQILAALARPVGQLVFIYPAEAFVTHIRVAVWTGWFAAAPVVIYQIWRFVSAGLLEKEKRLVFKFFPVSLLLFVLGATFGFFIVTNFGIQFLLAFGNSVMVPMISIGNYVSFIASLSLAFGFVFQLPLGLIILTHLGLVSPQLLAEKRRYAVIAILIVSAILTPGPDVFSQLCMAIPLLVLYEIGIISSKVVYDHKKWS